MKKRVMMSKMLLIVVLYLLCFGVGAARLCASEVDRDMHHL
jgi:uncharacterized membrane protein